MEDEPFTSRSISAICEIRQICLSFLVISVTIAVGLIILILAQVYQGKEFTVSEVVYITAVFTVCLVTIVTAITCHVNGNKTNKTTTKGGDKRSNMAKKMHKLNALSVGILPAFLGKPKKRTVLAKVTFFERSPNKAPGITGFAVRTLHTPMSPETFV